MTNQIQAQYLNTNDSTNKEEYIKEEELQKRPANDDILESEETSKRIKKDPILPNQQQQGQTLDGDVQDFESPPSGFASIKIPPKLSKKGFPFFEYTQYTSLTPK